MELRIVQGRGVDSETDDVADNSSDIAKTPGSTPASVMASPGVITPGATLLLPSDDVVRLPAGTRLDAIRISGANLVITLPDGQVIVVIDGALHPPQIVLGTISISATNIAALIASQEPEPAAGAPQSSGGNFVEAVGNIGDSFGLGDLLPATDFGFGQVDDDEVIPSAIDNDPELTIATPDQPDGSAAATSTVSEAALGARGNEPAGSNSSSNAETVSGTIQFASLDQPNVVAVNGTPVTAVGQIISTPVGILTISSIAPGAIGYSYTWLDNSTNPEASEVLTVTVTDADGDVATATLTVGFTDDAPTSRADVENVAPNLYLAQTGNVVTGAGTASGAAGADILGADGGTVTGLRSSAATEFSAPGALIKGLYGTLVMQADGAYSYVRSGGSPGGVSDVFTYQLTDGDGDISTATLTFNIGDSAVGLVVPSGGDEGTIVDEAGLTERGNEQAGSRDGDGSNETYGVISFDAPDGRAIITINGVRVIEVDQEIELPAGTFYILAINRDSIEYAFILNDNVSATSAGQKIDVTVTDQDGDSASASFTIDIMDDAPTAIADTDRVAAGSYGPATGNVITDVENDGGRDIQGADGASVSTVSGAGGSVSPGSALAGLYGILTLNSNGSYSYVRNAGAPGGVSDIFTYTLKDGDGDLSTATLTISIGDGGVTLVVPDSSDEGTNVSEAGLPTGSAPNGGSATTSGSFAISVIDGPGKIFIDGVEVTAVGQTIAGTYGTLTITSINATTVGYSYTLTSASSGDGIADSFGIKVVDLDGDQVNGSLSITITDDMPSAADDVDFLNAGSAQPADGNVLTGIGGADGNNTDGLADVQGADGATVTGVSLDGKSGDIGGETSGNYGTLTLNSNGSYSYVIDNENPDVLALDGTETLTETFEYTITDEDGGESIATLTITIRGKDDVVVITGLNQEGAEATVSEANLDDGSVPDTTALTRNGSFSFNSADGLASLKIGDEVLFDGDIVDGLAISTANGILTITDFDPLYDSNGEIIGGTISYSYELTDNTLLHSGANGSALTESFAVLVQDSDGTLATSSLDVQIIDDSPLAKSETSGVGEGATLIADESAGLLANDLLGADEATLVGIRASGGDSTTPVAGGIGLAIAGLYGTLTVAQDGSYSYISPPNIVPPAGANDVFVYTIRDGDGDLSTTTLTIGLSDSGLSTASLTLQTNENALPNGSDPDSPEAVVSGDLNANVTGGNGPYEFTLVGDGIGNNGIFELNADGTYTYTMLAPVQGATANNGSNTVPVIETYTYIVIDALGNTTQNTIVIDVVDDVPVAVAGSAVTVAEDAPLVSGNLLDNDTLGADSATVTSVNISGVNIAILADEITVYANALGTYTFDAEGNWTFDPKPASSAVPLVADFSYTITDGDGDTSTTVQQIRVADGANPTVSAPLTLTADDENLATGTNPDINEPVTVSGNLVFNSGSDAIASIVFGDVSGLGGGLTWTRVSNTQIIGMFTDIPVVTLDLSLSDNIATVTMTLESNYGQHSVIGIDDLASLGFASVIATDSDGDQIAGRINIVISDDVPTIIAESAANGMLTVDDTNLAVNATANLSSVFDIAFGADQLGTVHYVFNVTAASGLVDVATGAKIVLFSLGNVVEGRLQNTSTVAFRLTIDSNGQATLDQLRALQHDDANNPDDLVSMSSTIIRLTATVTDSDGDTATATAFVGNALAFKDDGPSIDANAVDFNVLTLTTQDADSRGAAFDVATANLSAAFSVLSSTYGVDGAPNGGSITWSYALALGSAAANTGLSSDGVAITLSLVGGQVVGSAGAATVFTVAVDTGTGILTLTQFAEIDHSLPGSASNYATQLVELATNLIELRGTATITDRDGDRSSDTIAIDLGGNIRFADDGPSVSAGGSGPELVLDESFLLVDASADLSGIFASTLDFGADGAGSVSYQLGVTAGPSGLIDTLSGEAVVLSIVGGVIYGRTTTQEVFRISVAANGVVTFDQSRAIVHSPESGPDQTLFLSGTNLITLTALLTDGDGDVASATADITGRFAIKDDTSVAINDEDSVARDGQVFADGNVLTGLGGSDDNGTDGVADNGGADGGLLVTGIAFNATSGTLGSALAGNYGSLVLAANGSYRYDLDVADPEVVALGANQTLTDVFTYTVTDADGDSSTATITISITGANDFPVARADTNWVLDGISGSDPSAVGNVFQDINHSGAPSGSYADVADYDPDLEAITVTSAGTYAGLYGTLVIAANGAYTYTLNEDNAAVNALDAGQTLIESFGYTISDGQLAVNSTLTITVFGANDAPTIGTATARVSEEGLSGGNPDNAPNAALDTTNSVTASGSIAIDDTDAGEILTATLGDPGAVLTAGGAPVIWSGIGTGTLIGSVGGNEVIRITLASNGAYTVTLSRAVDHPTIALEDLREFSVPVSVSDGSVTTTNGAAIRIIIEDDAPQATNESGATNQPAQDINTLFILDFSASIDNSELDIMLDAVKNALTELDAAATGSLNIKFVIFSSTAFSSGGFTSAVAANAYLDSLNPSEGGTRPNGIGGNTDYTAAVQAAMASFVPITGASNQVFFLSDGNPNEQIDQIVPGDPRITPTTPIGTVMNSLTSTAATNWNNFVDGNNINVTAIGVANAPGGISVQRLRDVDLNDAPSNVPIVVDDFADLVATLVAVVVPATVTGDLDSNDSYGADGGRIVSITVGSTTYIWDGADHIGLSGGGAIAGTTINAATPHGGTLTLNFATGQYSYQPPSPITVTATEVFSYSVVDKDGDTATASLSVTIIALVPPVVLDLDGDGLEFVSHTAGVLFDYDGDGVAESTAWVGPDDGLLVVDKNGDGKVNDGSEIVFAAGSLTDLEGLAANYDTNEDGKLDSADADFAKFGVWQDANSNGITDAGEFRSLGAAGIQSISLVSDGRSYSASNGYVIVRGESVYTNINGSTGKVGDAAFATNFANDSQRAVANSSVGLSAALIAAGLVAALPLAAQVREETLPDAVNIADASDNKTTQMVEPFTVEVDHAPDVVATQSDDMDVKASDQPSAKLRLEADDHELSSDQDGISILDHRGSGGLQSEQLEIKTEAGPSSPLNATGDQVLLPSVPLQDSAMLTVDEIEEIVVDSIEGRTLDLDAVIAAYISPDQTTAAPLANGSQSAFFAGNVDAEVGDLFMTDMSDQHVLVQMEQMAASGHL